MIHKTLTIQFQGFDASLTTYVLDNHEEMDNHRIRPLILICPGGGYRYTSEREAEPVALRMNTMGYHAAVLRYSCDPAPYSVALGQLCLAMELIRSHGAEWNVDENNIIVAGGSAGGHLALSLGVYWNQPFLWEYTKVSGERMKPSGLILSYPVVRCEPELMKSSEMVIRQNDLCPQLFGAVRLDSLVNSHVPPVFVWHTYTDRLVTVKNSLWLAERLEEYKVPLELHIYPAGDHGLSLGTMETYIKAEGFGYQEEIQNWIDMAGRWVKHLDDYRGR